MRKTLSNFATVLTGLLLGVAWAATAAEPVAKGKTATATAVFAGGCFWCMEPPYDKLPGVVATTSGYTGGQKLNPTYEQVSAGDSGHIEAVQITYDPKQVSYEKLLEVFWRNVDPLDRGGQFCDRGSTYTTAIFVQNQEERKIAEQSKAAAEKKLGKKIVTAIRPTATFYAAEDYHQDYYQKNPLRYKYYRYSCGRDQRLGELWGKKG
ncbi:MAG: peptide-methionine (S)-S-oxide reductase [Candidatus Muproteobacteria bacterium RIFCSPHIGHO2_12_FULL_60_33]|nr:MAG: peptide-methionine (S)-S-oxide reductase [Candidatus Muproteobacteria bacterium RIFCSPHIGHO2_01_60_12]OGI54870.1 MAG: peptide-methionine (S)-S-oxide reductase [Candidatus Muproteobacteria bacterium RIFCSPHIGHO2_12_FULL_60_33]OGI57988.1 MAG: peptide-methionine (S)-S-oxide reductase [Candidatus Muproteobacteria bacterium RIFCSPHIGHO2_01_FULL_61_200]